jgi:hypothetical protein
MNRLAKLRNYCGEQASLDLKSSLDSVANHLSQGPLSGTVAFVVIEENRRRLLIADLNKSGVDEVEEEKTVIETTNFVVYVQYDTLMGSLRGDLSPITALLRGRLRFSGDEKPGLAVFRELASTRDAVFEPVADLGHSLALGDFAAVSPCWGRLGRIPASGSQLSAANGVISVMRIADQ